MRIDGVLAKWNDDRGFGFIVPTVGGQDIFIHISAFPKDGQRPRVGELLSFEIEADGNGKKRAKAVSRPARAATSRASKSRSPRPRAPRNLLGRFVPLVILAALGAYGYGEYARTRAVDAVAGNAESHRNANPVTGQDSTPAFRCDGRTHCSAMRSCAEAKYFLSNCPGVEMDGDRDGIPCEEQWCNAPFAR